MEAEQKPKWGDQDEFDEYDAKDFNQITTEHREDPDGTIHKTIVEYRTNENGQQVKVVKKIALRTRIVKISKRVEQRKKWKKFGECAMVVGIEPGITSTGDETYIEPTKQEGKEEKTKAKTKDVMVGMCRICQGDHWTLRCPYKDKPGLGGMTEKYKETTPTDAEESVGRPGDSKYVPPGMRGKESSGGDSMKGGPGGRREEGATVRVTNLSEDVKESDLQDLFRSFGKISRIYLAKDKHSGLSKGFAFINFENKEDASRAIEKLSRFGYDHLILNVEWAKPSTK